MEHITPIFCRTTLSVPGYQTRMHAKAAASGADAIMLDLEDSVPLDQKAAAREAVARSLATLDFKNKTRCLRINGADTPFAYRDLVEVVEAAGEKLDAVVVPKVNHEGDIHYVARLLDGIEMATGILRPIRIQACIETAAGLSRVTEIAGSDPRVYALAFGIADYQASIGAGLISLSGHGENEEAHYPGHRWHFPVSRMVMAAKACGLLALDAPFGNFKDPDGLKRSASLGRSLGCDGKWVIHPDQIETVNACFSPEREEILRARRILDAVQSAGAGGACAVDGRMVDLATVRLARRVWEQAVGLKLT